MPEPRPPQQPKKPKSKTEKIVWIEINSQKNSRFQENERTPEKLASEYLNNFYCKLPSAIARTAYEHWAIKNEDENSLNSARSYLKKKQGESYSNEGVAEERFKFSQRFLDQTQEEFLGSIDEAIQESGVDRQKLIEYITIIDSDHHKYDPKIEMTLIFPIYIKLREKGYTHRDLAT